MALVAILTAGLIGGGVAGLSQFAEADRPDLAAQATDDSSDDTLPPVDDTVPPDDDRDDEPIIVEVEPDGETPAPDEPNVDGEITIDIGDGDPIVLDLDDIGDDTVARVTECLGLPVFDFSFDIGEWQPGDGPFADGPLFDLDELFDDEGDLDELFDDFSFDFDLDGEFGAFDTDGSVTVTGPDGTSVVDLGENGSVTVTKDGDDVTITTEGDATVSDLADLFDDFGAVFESMPFDDERFDELFDDEAFDEFIETLPNPDDITEFEPIDPDVVQSCLDEVLGR